MKAHALTLLIILLVSFGCRSSRNSIDTSVRESTNEVTQESQTQKISLDKSLLATTRTATQTNIDERIRITRYHPDGSISEVQEQWRTVGQTELADGTRSQSDVSGIETTKVKHSVKKRTTDFSQKQLKYSDSRAVQGWQEWGVITLICVAAIFIFYFIKRAKK